MVENEQDVIENEKDEFHFNVVLRADQALWQAR